MFSSEDIAQALGSEMSDGTRMLPEEEGVSSGSGCSCRQSAHPSLQLRLLSNFAFPRVNELILQESPSSARARGLRKLQRGLF